MRCLCGGRLMTISTRLHNGGGIRRRRRCADCGDRITTVEIQIPALAPDAGKDERKGLRQ